MTLAQAGREPSRPTSAAAAAALHVEEIVAPEALDALRPEWAELYAAAPEATPFQSPEWLLSWRGAFLPGGDLWTLAVRREGELVGLAPFYIHEEPETGRRRLTLLGNGASDHQALLAHPHTREVVGEALAWRLALRRELWNLADFRDLPEDSPLLRLRIDPGAVERVEPEEPCPALDLPSDPDAVLAALPASRRTDLRRCARRLGELGPLTLTRAEPGDLDEHLEALVRLHGARRRAHGEAGVFADPAALAFHRAAAPQLLAAGRLRLEALRLGGRIIAVHYGLRRGDRAYGYLHAFDPALAAFGPGWLLVARCLQAAVRDGVRRYDFLRGREPYKYAWGAADQPQWRRRIWR